MRAASRRSQAAVDGGASVCGIISKRSVPRSAPWPG